MKASEIQRQTGSKAQVLIEQMRNKVYEKDKQYHITEPRRNQSEDRLRDRIERVLTLDELSDIQEHP